MGAFTNFFNNIYHDIEAIGTLIFVISLAALFVIGAATKAHKGNIRDVFSGAGVILLCAMGFGAAAALVAMAMSIGKTF